MGNDSGRATNLPSFAAKRRKFFAEKSFHTWRFENFAKFGLITGGQFGEEYLELAEIDRPTVFSFM